MSEGGKLHQVLAVEKDKENQKKKIMQESIKVLGDTSLHQGSLRVLQMFAQERKNEEDGQSVQKSVTTDVMTRIKYTLPFMAQHLDIVYQKELTNTLAKANVIVDGIILMRDVPATMLLALEREFTSYRDMFKAVPTLQSGIDWERDDAATGKVYKTKNPVKTQKLSKEVEYRVVVKPTDKHPAQVKEISISKQVGEYTDIKWSGCVTSAKKAKMINKLESLIQAVKIARAKANAQDIKKSESVKSVLDWIIKD